MRRKRALRPPGAKKKFLPYPKNYPFSPSFRLFAEIYDADFLTALHPTRKYHNYILSVFEKTQLFPSPYPYPSWFGTRTRRSPCLEKKREKKKKLIFLSSQEESGRIRSVRARARALTSMKQCQRGSWSSRSGEKFFNGKNHGDLRPIDRKKGALMLR